MKGKLNAIVNTNNFLLIIAFFFFFNYSSGDVFLIKTLSLWSLGSLIAVSNTSKETFVLSLYHTVRYIYLLLYNMSITNTLIESVCCTFIKKKTINTGTSSKMLFYVFEYIL